MVHIARGALDRAESVLREGTIVQDRQADLKQRYPAKGLHWLLGLVRLARGDAAEALLEFDREIAQRSRTALCAGVRDERARRRGLRAPADRRSGRCRVPIPQSARALSRPRKIARGSRRRLCRPMAMPRRPKRLRESRSRRSMLCAAAGAPAKRRWPKRPNHVVRRREDAAVNCLQTLLDRPEMSFTGWTIPVEPLFQRAPRQTRFSAHFGPSRRARPLISG